MLLIAIKFLAPSPSYGPPSPSYAQPAEIRVVKIIQEQAPAQHYSAPAPQYSGEHLLSVLDPICASDSYRYSNYMKAS